VYGLIMHRKLIVVVAASAVTLLLAASAGAALVPIVSPRSDPYYSQPNGLRNTKGFGEVKPRTIFYGGDPTGLVCSIHWYQWGGPVARGVGKALYVGRSQSVAQGHSAKVNVVASRLGTWNGRPAYDQLKWFFTNNGRDRRGPLCL
jgi:hypothetical protein